eukprot:CAMPEP_0117015630 /NCGR_PEP_ID=MMETSP0472-20121206/12448_1 /TAXON_ID=693140 ORGANISM="Tiarina fusus, Strain LIS" /NCGR_SAMPLE_ID=MMETSP0472 /ASSEMBLY_ACC=CAM_ASM_000603 /LENGTH=351 /DNA_ID=CAMNT_0004719467 /DNA_START=1576 /DNA_END=2631 /DNA_ORIENTATION=+
MTEQLRNMVGALVSVGQSFKYSEPSINNFIDCIAECDSIIKLSKCFKESLRFISEIDPMEGKYHERLCASQVLCCFLPFLKAVYLPYEMQFEPRFNESSKWLQKSSFNRTFLSLQPPKEPGYMEIDRPFFEGPIKRVPRYQLMYSYIKKNVPNMLSLHVHAPPSPSTKYMCTVDFSASAEIERLFSRQMTFEQPDISIGKLSSLHLNVKLPLVCSFFDFVYNREIEIVREFLFMDIIHVNIAIWWKPSCDSGLDIFRVINRFYQGTTALFIASAVGDIEMVKLLLEFGANPKIPRYDGRTPWSVAKEAGNVPLCDLLLDAEELFEDQNLSSVAVVPWLVRHSNEVHSSRFS